MSRTHVKSMIGLPLALALVLAAAPSGMAQSVKLPTGWKTPSELYAKLAKVPADQLEKILYTGAKQAGSR